MCGLLQKISKDDCYSSGALSNLAKCCYYRRNGGFSICNTLCPGTTGCIDTATCNDPNIDWNICNNISNEEIIKIVTNCSTAQVNPNSPTGTSARNCFCSSMCCAASGNPYSCKTLCQACGIGGASYTPLDQITTCDPLGGPPPGTINDIAFLSGICLNGKCNFQLGPDACSAQCLAFEDPCRRYMCERYGITPCPGVFVWTGCGCPDPGFAYQGCPGSSITPGLPPSPLTAPPEGSSEFKNIHPEIKLVKVTINNLETCIPVICEGNCDGYTLCE